MGTIPTYIKSLLAPNGSKPQGRKSWGIDLETVFIPFFTATNCEGLTAIPHDALGAPIRLGYEKDGSVKFNERTGKPVQKIAPDLSAAVKLVRENFVASLQLHSGQVLKDSKDAYQEQLRLNKDAGMPIVNRDRVALDAANENRLLAFLAASKATPEATPEVKELVTA